MTKYHLGSDRSGGGDEECLEAIKSALESAGHEVNYLRIDPNLEGDLASNVKEGEIGLYGVNGFCIGTIASVSSMAKKKGIDIIFFAMKSHTAYCEEPDFSNKKVGMAHDDNFSSAETRAKFGGGKCTPKEVVDQCDNVTFVPWQGSCEKQAEGIMNGATGSGGTDSSSGESKPMSGWESLCDLLKPLDGLAMMLQRGDTVIIKRIEVPGEPTGDASLVTHSSDFIPLSSEDKDNGENEKDTGNETGENTDEEKSYVTVNTVSDSVGMVDNPTVNEGVQLYAYEGVNVVADSVTVTEYSPEIYNTLEIFWGENYENSFILTFERHKELFGERKLEVQACNKESKPASDEKDKDDSSNSESKDETSENKDEDK